MDHANQILLSLFIVFFAGQVGAEVAQRLRLPSVVGQIAAGAVIGPSVLAWATPNQPLEVLAQIGAIFLLFSVGLETRLVELRKVGGTAFLVAVLGVILPFIAGGLWGWFEGFTLTKSAFVAAAFVATSAGITAKVLQELGVLSRTEAKIILGAAVIDDVLAMLVLGVVSALQTQTGVNFLHLGMVALQAVAFLAVVAVLGSRVMRHSSELLEMPVDADSPLAISLAICLGLAAAATFTGLAAIIGAFLAGMILAETKHREEITSDVRPILSLMLPFFFVTTGMLVDVRVLSSWPMVAVVLVVSLLATVSKMVGCGLGARALGFKGALIVGVGMVPRGEVGIIVASLGRQVGVFSDSTYAIVIAMSLVTSIVAPPALKVLFRQKNPASSGAARGEATPAPTEIEPIQVQPESADDQESA